MRVRTGLIFLVGVGVLGVIGLSLRREAAGVGGRLVEAMEKESGVGRLRGAVMVVDYVPEEGAVGRVRAEVWRSGTGSGEGMNVVAGDAERRWMAGDDFEMTWKQVEKSTLAESLGDAERVVRRGLEGAGFVLDRPGELAKGAVGALRGETDERLLLEWIRADRGVLERMEEVERAAREGVLLATDGPGDPVLTFRVGGTRVYLWGMGEGRCAMRGFDGDGRAEWEGVLILRGKVEAERVRVVGVGVAERVSK